MPAVHDLRRQSFCFVLEGVVCITDPQIRTCNARASGSRLLQRMREFVSENFLSRITARRILTCAENDILAHCVGKSTYGSR